MKILKNTYHLCLIAYSAIISVYTYYLTPILHSTPTSTDDLLFERFFSFFYSIYALIALAMIWGTYKTGAWLRPFLLALSSYILFIATQLFTLNELKDFRTYGYELFIVSFYTWLCLMTITLLATLLYPKTSTKFIRIGALLALISIPLFALTGRGGLDHIMPLIGGFYLEYSWDAALVGKLIYFAPIIALIGCIAPLVYLITHWVQHGVFAHSKLAHCLSTTFLFLCFTAASLISIPAGEALNNKDISDSKLFINQLITQIQDYYKEHSQYPKHILQIIDQNTPVPRLLERYDYLAEDTKGGYFLSNEHKYCFIFQDPGKDFGYYSITSNRTWRFSHEGKNLSEEYLSVCDEDAHLFSGENLVAGHLGIQTPGDPIREMTLELEDKANQLPMTQATTYKLQQRLAIMAGTDPSLSTAPLPDPHKNGELVNSTQGVKQAIINGPLDNPESYDE